MKLLATSLYFLLLLTLFVTPSCEPLDLTQFATITPNEDEPDEPEEPEVPKFSIAFSGDGTSSSPYLISSLSDLELLSTLIASGERSYGIYFQLTTDLNLYGSSTNQWTPIGSLSTPFKGTFDGGDHLISGIYINTTINDCIGLFGYTSYATIRDLEVSGTIAGNDYVGGVIGRAYSSTVSDCYNTGYVSGSSNVGGVVGYNTSSTVSNCYNTGNVSGSSYVGGVVGYSSSISNCYNTGIVSGSSNYVGGVVGYSSSISNCYNTGDVSGSGYNVGGVVGYSSSSISNCYNTGDVSGSSDVGGVVGDNTSSTVSNCYNTGDVSGSGYNVGGVVGYNSSSASVSNCYWLSGCCEEGDSYGTEKSESEMKASEMVTLLGSTYWKMDSGSVNGGYPILSWQ